MEGRHDQADFLKKSLGESPIDGWRLPSILTSPFSSCLLPDVHIASDHKSGPQAGKYVLSLQIQLNLYFLDISSEVLGFYFSISRFFIFIC